MQIETDQEVAMTHGSPSHTEVHVADAEAHAITWTLSLFGALAAAIGVWIVLAPDNGTISVFGRSWLASDLVGTWGPWLMIVGGGVAAVGMATSILRDIQHEASRLLIGAEMLLATGGIGALIAGFLNLG